MIRVTLVLLLSTAAIAQDAVEIPRPTNISANGWKQLLILGTADDVLWAKSSNGKFIAVFTDGGAWESPIPLGASVQGVDRQGGLFWKRAGTLYRTAAGVPDASVVSDDEVSGSLFLPSKFGALMQMRTDAGYVLRNFLTDGSSVDLLHEEVASAQVDRLGRPFFFAKQPDGGRDVPFTTDGTPANTAPVNGAELHVPWVELGSLRGRAVSYSLSAGQFMLVGGAAPQPLLQTAAGTYLRTGRTKAFFITPTATGFDIFSSGGETTTMKKSSLPQLVGTAAALLTWDDRLIIGDGSGMFISSLDETSMIAVDGGRYANFVSRPPLAAVPGGAAIMSSYIGTFYFGRGESQPRLLAGDAGATLSVARWGDSLVFSNATQLMRIEGGQSAPEPSDFSDSPTGGGAGGGTGSTGGGTGSTGGGTGTQGQDGGSNDDPSGGCGCSTTSGVLAWAAIIGLVKRRRRVVEQRWSIGTS